MNQTINKLFQLILPSGRGGKQLIITKEEYYQLKQGGFINITKSGKEYIIHNKHRVWIKVNEKTNQ